MSSESFSCLLGQYGSFSTAAQQPLLLSENILHNPFRNPTPTTVLTVLRISILYPNMKYIATSVLRGSSEWRSSQSTTSTSSPSTATPATSSGPACSAPRGSGRQFSSIEIIWVIRVGEDTFEMYLRYRYRYMKGCIFCIF